MLTTPISAVCEAIGVVRGAAGVAKIKRAVGVVRIKRVVTKRINYP